MFVTNDDALYERVLTLSNHGSARGEPRQFWSERIGFKYKMSNIQAAIGCAQVERMPELLAGKRRVFEHYANAFANLPVRMNPEPPGTINGYWMPTIIADRQVKFDREALLAAMREEEIDGRVFFWPLSSMPGFAGAPRQPVASSLHLRGLNLPSYHDLTAAEMDRVVDVISRFLVR